MNAIWIDKQRRKYSIEEITDAHLVNILVHVDKGGGWDSVVTVGNMEVLYDEAVSRGLAIPVGKFSFLRKVEERVNYIDPSDFIDDLWFWGD